jgi:hypothetical protein
MEPTCRLRIQPQAEKKGHMEMIIMSPNKKWSNLTPREKAPFVLRGLVQFALLAAALADIQRRPAEEINGSKWLWSAVAFVNFMGIGPDRLFPLRAQARLERRIAHTEGKRK